MGSAKTKVRIFSIGLTSVILITVLGAILRSGLVLDINTVQLMIFTMFVAALVTIASMYAALVLFVEGLLIKWGNKVFEAQQKDKDNDYLS